MSDTIDRLNNALEGRYKVEREIGEGGMATVYLAHDLKHDRKVALKVLKPELAAVVGAERFLAEIKTTANLQHPHILPLYDSGEVDKILFYVMPFVEGETLRDRLDREKQLPVNEAVRIAVAVAGALDYAHRHEVVHRDIKPGNILMQDGQPVVGDFGIALAVGSAGGARLTETGLSVGTPYYMSPEQATGDILVGPASDTYALAAVLYELLTGEPPYTGTTAQAVLGRIIQGAPVSATAIRKSVPPNVDAAVRKGLEKLPADRFSSAQEFGKALTDPSFRHGEGALAGAGAGGFWNKGTVALAALAVASTAGLAWSLATSEPLPTPSVERFESPLRADQLPVATPITRGLALSPDGRFLVYPGSATGAPFQLWIRRWDDPVAQPVRGTELGLDPVVSPDGQELAFTQGGDVKVLPLEGGPARTLGSGSRPWWGPEGFVYMGTAGIHRVPGGGGALEDVTEPGEDEVGSRILGFFPGGEALQQAALTSGESEIRVLDMESGEATHLAFGDYPQLSPTGHLLFLSEGTLMAAPMDLEKAELLSQPVALIENVGAYTISQTGKLFYSVGGGGGGVQEMVWVSRAGAATPVDPGWQFDYGGSNAGWSLSPDGAKIALRARTDAGMDVWIKELPDGPLSRLTFDEGEDRKPVWGPDPETVTFISARNGNEDVYSRKADGTGEAELLYDNEIGLAEATWSPDGQWLVVRTGGLPGVAGGRDVLAVRRGGEEVRPLLTTDRDEVGPVLSPDGRWLAYTTNETGRYEVFVRPFPDVDSGRWQVSTGGGFTPRWAHSGRELFFVDAGQHMMVAQVQTDGGFRVVSRDELFEIPQDFMTSDIAVPYDVALDDQSVLMARDYRRDASSDQAPAYMLVVNWFEELKSRVPR